MDYKKVASTRFNSHTINMETGAQRGEDMSKVMSFTFKIHSIISQTMFIDVFLGVCPMLRAVGWEWRRLCHKKEKHKSYSWYQRTYVLTGTFSPPPPQKSQLYLWLLLYNSLELSLLLEHN